MKQHYNWKVQYNLKKKHKYIMYLIENKIMYYSLFLHIQYLHQGRFVAPCKIIEVCVSSNFLGVLVVATLRAYSVWFGSEVFVILSRISKRTGITHTHTNTRIPNYRE